MKRFFSWILIFLCLFSLSSCASFKKESQMSKNISYSCQYIEESHTTNIKLKTIIYNDSIYEIDSFSVIFDFYSNGSYVGEQIYFYDIDVNENSNEYVQMSLTANGMVSYLELYSWSVTEYKSLWDTYKVWFITIIAITCISLLIYILYSLVKKTYEEYLIIEFIEDLFDGEHNGLLSCLGVMLVGGLAYGFVSNFMPVLIVLGGVISFMLFAILFDYIKNKIYLIKKTKKENKYSNEVSIGNNVFIENNLNNQLTDQNTEQEECTELPLQDRIKNIELQIAIINKKIEIQNESSVHITNVKIQKEKEEKEYKQSISSFVCSMFSVVLSCIPIINFIVGLCVFFSCYDGLIKTRKNKNGYGFYTAGFILSLISIIDSISLLVVFIIIIW